jgi:hypothetical protein
MRLSLSHQRTERPKTRRRPARRSHEARIEALEPRQLMAASFLQGYSYQDLNNNKQFDAGDLPKVGVQINLLDSSNNPVTSTTTNADGYYRFDNVAAGTYNLTENAPGFTPSADIQTTISSAVANGTGAQVTVYDPSTQAVTLTQAGLPQDPPTRTGYVLESNSSPATNAPGVYNNYTRAGDSTRQYYQSLSGNNGNIHFILSLCTDLFRASGSGYTLTPSLTPNSTTLTTNLGRIGYLYNHYGRGLLSADLAASLQLAVWELEYDATPDLNAGNFHLTPAFFATPQNVIDGANNFIGLSAGKDERAFFLVSGDPPQGVSQGMLTTDLINFANTGQPQDLAHGDTATIGFWHNNNGQALINSLNGGSTSTQLGNWLATSFPYLYGQYAGSNNLTGATNAQVAAKFLQFFGVSGQKTDAQIMAGALAVYVTDSDLAGTAAVGYGFTVTSSGTGAKLYNVGSYGSEIGLVDNQSYTIFQLLQQANKQKKDGTFDANAFNAIFDGINQKGDIK